MAEQKKLTDKLRGGKFKGMDYGQVIETDPHYIRDQMENYGLNLENCAFAYYVFNMERVGGSCVDSMY